jgi:glyoxylase-like metal-dependent hydrolase (beta-lactamase superfamily II)
MTKFELEGFGFQYLLTGSFEADPELFFAAAPEAEREETLERQQLRSDSGMMVFLVRSLLVETGSHSVVIDPAADWERPRGLELQLQRAGIDPGSIDTVIVSHAHADHYQGGVTAEGGPLFPNARYYMQRREWEHWLSPGNPEPNHVDDFCRLLLPIESSFTLLEGAQEIVPGIRCLPTPGHSPGHMVIEIGNNVIYSGDVLLSPPHIQHPDWYASFDVWADQVVATRRELVRQLAGSGKLVFACHFPGSGAGRVVRDGERLSWQPE